MSSFIADRLSRIQPSPTLAITALANKLKKEGKDVVGFGAGEPDFDTPDYIKQAAKDALDAGKTKYAAVPGVPELREAIVEKLKNDNGLDYKSENIIVSTGGKQVLFNLFLSVLNPGDEVIIPAPYWVSYADIVMLAEGTPVFVATSVDNNYQITPEQLEKSINDRTRAIIMNSPSNPTGSMYSAQDLKALAEVLKKHPHVLIVTDDIYEKLVYDNNIFANLAMVSPELKERTVVINGMSKAYSMTGWRLGYAACDQLDIIKAMSKLQGQSTSGANTFAQSGGIAALKGGDAAIEKMKVEFIKRRDFIVSKFEKIAGISIQKPQGAFYVFPDFKDVTETDGFKKLMSEHKDETDPGKVIAAVLLEKYLVAVVPGIAFGHTYGMRLSYATSMQQIEKGMQRITEFFDSLN